MANWTVPATVDRVIDGDTGVFQIDLGWRISLTTSVRLAGINAPELSTAAGKSARDFVHELLPVGAAVTLVSHKLLGSTDKYGRVLASITVPDGRDLASVLLLAGYAVPYDGS